MLTTCRVPAMLQYLQTAPSQPPYELVLEIRFLWKANCFWKANTRETSVGWKGNLALFWRPATWGDGRLLAKNQLWSLCSPWKIFKRRIIWVTGQSFLHSPDWLVGGKVIGPYPSNLAWSSALMAGAGLGTLVSSCVTFCNPMDCSLSGSSIPGKNTGVGCHFLLQVIIPTQGSNPGPLHCRQMLLPSEPPGKSLVSAEELKDVCVPWFGPTRLVAQG